MKYLHTPKRNNSGIHHVAIAQKKIVNPRMNGNSNLSSGDSGLFVTSIPPARVVMATAPMLIQ